MKRFGYPRMGSWGAMLLLVMLAVFATGCAGTTQQSVEQTSYATLDTFADVYDSAMKVSAKAVANGDMTRETYDKIAKVANIYRASGAAATDAADDYFAALAKDQAAADQNATTTSTGGHILSDKTVELKEAAEAALIALGKNYKSLLNLLKEFGLDQKIPILQLITL